MSAWQQHFASQDIDMIAGDLPVGAITFDLEDGRPVLRGIHEDLEGLRACLARTRRISTLPQLACDVTHPALPVAQITLDDTGRSVLRPVPSATLLSLHDATPR